ncbi:MAG: hypothetical protein KF830_08110 [Planctomycetes bacterium]|nr:hypothetical protein [Planctomycetota bacterium]
MLVCAALLPQVLLTVPLDGGPVRFGAPLPAAAVARGLRATGDAALQWRRLPIGDPRADPVWVELALTGRGSARIVAGGDGPCPDGCGPVVRWESRQQEGPHGRESTATWLWHTGERDVVLRVEFTAGAAIDGETFAGGEAMTCWEGDAASRARVLCRLPRAVFVAAGILPPAGSIGADLRRELAATSAHLMELPGRRGAGDFARSGGVVTNLEFDTTLAMLRFALATGEGAALARARRCAQHLRDRDLDGRTGLPFPHGPEHRTGTPAPGHAWLQGLLWTGLWFADDGLLAAARALAHGLAALPPGGERASERARDFAWPLGELEAWLRCEDDPVVALAADRLAVAIASRYDATARTFRFGEGEVGRGQYLERAWITGGIVLPALRAHLRRRPDPGLAARVHAVELALVRQVATAGAGVATHWRTAAGAVYAVHVARDDPRAVLLCEGLSAPALARLLRRSAVGDALTGSLRVDDPDLATSWTMVARCEWVWR